MICIYYLTYDCTSSCEFCSIWQDEDLKEVTPASFETIKKNLSDLKKLNIDHIYFTGGEPLLREDIPQILKYAKNIGLKVSLFSNGVLYKQISEELSGNIDYLYLSLDAPVKEIHDEIRGEECFDNVIESISAAQKLSQKTIINFTLSRANIQFLPEMVDIAEKYNAILNINPVYNLSGLDGFEKRSIEYIKRYQRKKNVYINNAVLEFIHNGGNNAKNPSCSALDAAITISPDDKLIIPCFITKQAQIPIEGNLYNIYHSDIIKGYKKLQGKLKKCEGCMCWDYIVPSFRKKLSKYYLLDLFSKKI